MQKFQAMIYLNAYADTSASNSPSLNSFRWTREINGVPATDPISASPSLAPGESKVLFSGTRTLSHDGTTNYSIALKPLTSNTYVLSVPSGTLPNFRTPRAIGSDATSQITVTRNGPLTIFTSVAGTLLNLASVVVGDLVRIGSVFNYLSQGEYKILSKTSTSFTVENQLGVSEGPITLGAGFASQIQIYSSAGVQVNDTIVINGGFSSVSQGSYNITSVGANFLEFYSTAILPQESNIQTNAISIYSSAKSFVYIESDKNVSVLINGSLAVKIEPFVIGSTIQPGVFMLKSTVYSLEVQSASIDTANLFLATVE